MLLIQFLCWENSHFSQIALSEVLGHIGYSYSPELKTFLDILTNLLRIEDSWQMERVKCALKGISVSITFVFLISSNAFVCYNLKINLKTNRFSR